MTHTLAIITVVYKNYSILEDFFKSFERQNNRNFHFFIVDLSPTPQKITTAYPNTVLTSANLGYAHGVNVGIREALKHNMELFCIMNCDTYVKDNFVEKVVSSLSRHSGSVIGGKIYYAPGYEFHQDRYPKSEIGSVLWYAGGHTDWNHAYSIHRGVDEIDEGQYDTEEKTDFIAGTLMCYDKSVHDKVGFWDESYFLYYEDADFCERAKARGLDLYYDPAIVIWHKNAQSTGGSGSNIHTKYQRKNIVKFGLKYAPLRTKIHLLKNYFFS